jgi:glycosyltransferase involved in cell wall biosynthesis
VKFHVVRNIPDRKISFTPKSRIDLGLPQNKKIIILQGAGINIGRGAEELVEAMKKVEGAMLLVVGGGDVWDRLETMVSALKLHDRVILKKKMPASELIHYTANADLGISIDKPTNRNYFLSLPNKLFDYIQAGIPVLCSRLPEIEKIVTEFQIGGFIEEHSPDHISLRIREMFGNPILETYRKNARLARETLSWQSEKLVLENVLRNLK